MPDKLEMELIKTGDIPLTALGLEKMRPDLGFNNDAAKKALQRSKASDPKRLLFALPVLVKSTVIIAVFKSGNKRKTIHKHLFLPLDYSGEIPRIDVPALVRLEGSDKRKAIYEHLSLSEEYSDDPTAISFTPWTDTEVLAHLEAGWGEGSISDLELVYLYGPEPVVSG